MNSLKHAFPNEKAEGKIVVAFDTAGTDWKLLVSDNGIGRQNGTFAEAKKGLGTGIVKALAQQLDAKVETSADASGTVVSITHATFRGEAIRAA
jgi:chemotaxis protein methyltransferase CheR